MEIRTCEEYVLNELNKAQEEVEQARDAINNLQRLLYTIQNGLELFIDEDGSMRVEVDEFVSDNPEIKNIIVKVLGRGKYDDIDANAEENVEA